VFWLQAFGYLAIRSILPNATALAGSPSETLRCPPANAPHGKLAIKIMSRKQTDSDLVKIDHVPDAVWLNFSFMVRESITATEVRTGMEKSQHLTSALYFGTVALEAFLNEQMRAHMTSEPEEAIVNKLRRAVLKDKIKKWPLELLGKSLNINGKNPRFDYRVSRRS